jgi:hypothetical protein
MLRYPITSNSRPTVRVANLLHPGSNGHRRFLFCRGFAAAYLQNTGGNWELIDTMTCQQL